MIPVFVEGPAVEPISLSDMKAYLRLEDGGQDDLVLGLIKAARLMVEAASRRLLVEQRWRIVMDRWPKGGTVLLPLSPVLAVDGVRILDAAGAATDLPPGSIEWDAASDPPCLTVSGAPEPGKARHGIEIALRAGYGASPEAVPETLRLAIRILVAHWFGSRDDIAGEPALPPDAAVLMAPFRQALL